MRKHILLAIALLMFISAFTACSSDETLSGRYNMEVNIPGMSQIPGMEQMPGMEQLLGMNSYLEFDNKNVIFSVMGISATARYSIDGNTLTIKDNDLSQSGLNFRLNSDRTRITMGGMPGAEVVYVLEGSGAQGTPATVDVFGLADTSVIVPAPAPPMETEPPYEDVLDVAVAINEAEPEPTPEPYVSLNLPIQTTTTTFQSYFSTYFRITPEGVFQRGNGLRGGQGWTDIDTDVRSIELTGDTTMYIKNDNTLWGYGRGRNGILGDGTGLDREEPIMILEDVVRIYPKGGHSVSSIYALKTDGTLWFWGFRENGNDFEPKLYASDIVDVRVGYPSRYQDIIHASSGVLLRLHLGATTPSQFFDTPMYKFKGELFDDIKGYSYVTDFSGLYIDGNNVLWSKNRIGNNEKIALDADDIFDVNRHLFYISDNTLWGRGENSMGELGDGTKVRRDDFVQIAENVQSVRRYGFLTTNGEYWSWNRDNPTPTMTLDGVAYMQDDMIFLENGTLIYNDSYGSQYEIESVAIPQVLIFE